METALTLKIESQLMGVSEIQSRYSLLEERYHSDLKRLDFISKVLTISLHFRKFLVPFVDKIYYIHTVRTLKINEQ